MDTKTVILLGTVAISIVSIPLLFLTAWMKRCHYKNEFDKMCSDSGIIFMLPVKWKCKYDESVIGLEPAQLDVLICIEYHMLIEEVLEFEKTHIETMLEDETVIPLICDKDEWTVHGLTWEVYTWNKSARVETAGMKAFLRLDEYYITIHCEIDTDLHTFEPWRLYRRTLATFGKVGGWHEIEEGW